MSTASIVGRIAVLALGSIGGYLMYKGLETRQEMDVINRKLDSLEVEFTASAERKLMQETYEANPAIPLLAHHNGLRAACRKMVEKRMVGAVPTGLSEWFIAQLDKRYALTVVS